MSTSVEEEEEVDSVGVPKIALGHPPVNSALSVSRGMSLSSFGPIIFLIAPGFPASSHRFFSYLLDLGYDGDDSLPS